MGLRKFISEFTRREAADLKDRTFDEDGMHFQVLKWREKQWMRIDDTIAYLKRHPDYKDGGILHSIVRELIKMKNS